MKNGIILIIILISHQAFSGESNLFGDEPKNLPVSESKIKTIFSGVIDFRLIKTGEAENWNEGGTGLSAYGAETNGPLGGSSNPVTGFKLPRISLISDVMVKNEFNAHVQFNYDDHINSENQAGSFGVVEAFVAPHMPGPTQIRAGLLIPPISLEHPKAGWNTLYTITPSAINSWVGEELRTLALEVTHRLEINNDSHLNLTLAPYSGNDPASAILSFRGWAMHDYQYKQGDRLRFQPDTPVPFSANGWDTPSKETDGRLGVYAKASYELSDKLLVEAFYLQSNSLSTSVDQISAGNDYGWNATFKNIGVKWQPHADWTFISQYMTGTNNMGEMNGQTAVRNSYSSWFALASYKYDQDRFSYRHDNFEVTDHDSTAIDKNDQRGSAETFCYSYEINNNDSLSTEYIHILSTRDGNTRAGSRDPNDDLVQVNYRLYF